ncbi:MAG: stage III sporulation protein AA [Christensenellales bacterium]|jgi:stage III sporulation protein AA
MDNTALESVLINMPTRIRSACSPLLKHEARLEEIRIRAERPLMAWLGTEAFLGESGICALENALLPSKDEVRAVIESLCGYSIYAFEDDIAAGFITISGGHRIGLSGRAVIKGGRVVALTSYSGINIRFSRQVTGCAKKLVNYICHAGRPLSTLIYSPPQMGKTTMVRDLVRCVSNGIGCSPQKVCVVDERGEIAACRGGVPQNDVGIRTDVLDGFPKNEGISNAIRCLSPQVVAVDELGKPGDAESVLDALCCGIRVIATAHAGDMDDLRARPWFHELIRGGGFERYVCLGSEIGVGTVMSVHDAGGGVICSTPFR